VKDRDPGEQVVAIRFRVEDAEARTWHVDGEDAWPLRTLVAFLSEGRDGASIRRVLAEGSLASGGLDAQWASVEVSSHEMLAIEHSFPRALDPAPDAPLAGALDLGIHFEVPAVAPVGRAELDPSHPEVARAMSSLRYDGFDVAAWADRFGAESDTLPAPGELMGAVRRGRWRGGRRLAARMNVPVPAELTAQPPEGCLAALLHAPRIARLGRQGERWHASLFAHAARTEGFAVRAYAPRPDSPAPWPAGRAPWRTAGTP